MGKKSQGATSQPGDAGSNPSVDQATDIVAAMTEPMPAGDEPPVQPAAPKKVRGMEQPTDEEIREAIRNPRNDAMEAIARRRAEDLGVEPEDDLNADPDVDPADATAAAARKALEQGQGGTPAEERAQDEPSQTEQQLAGDLIDDPARFKVKLKVDGKEVVVPLDEIVRTAQKDQSADRRLAEATRLLNEAKSAVTAPPPPKDEPAPAPVASSAEKIKEFVAATYSGDEERLAKATAELLGGAQPAQAAPATPAFSEEVLSRVVQQELRKSEVASALTKFKSANAEIVGDPHLAMVADQFLAAATQGVPLEALPTIEDVNAALNKAASQTRDWAKGLGMNLTPKTDSTTRRDRVERKKEIDDLPSINAAANTVTPPPPTVQDTIAEMRKARGLPV